MSVLEIVLVVLAGCGMAVYLGLSIYDLKHPERKQKIKERRQQKKLEKQQKKAQEEKNVMDQDQEDEYE